MDLSIIIVNWNTRELVAGCLDSLKPQLEEARIEAEVMVIDNASSDGSPEMLENHYSWVRVIRSETNLGFAGGNNLGILSASGRSILLLNSDTVARPGALESMLSFLDAHPEAGAAGARLLNADGSLQESCYPAPTLLREFWRLFYLDKIYPLGVYAMGAWEKTGPREVDNILGACMFIRREVVDRVGPMDESYFMFSEEIDWCKRIRDAGWKIYWVPSAQILHYGGQSTVQVQQEMFMYLYRSKIRYFRKHFGSLRALVYKLIIAAATLLRLVGSPLAWLLDLPSRTQKRMLAGYYSQLLRALPRM